MTQEIIEMAQECGLIGMRPHLDGIYSEALVAFAKLVAEFERANNALLCYEQRKHWDALACADAIRAGTRARGQA